MSNMLNLLLILSMFSHFTNQFHFLVEKKDGSGELRSELQLDSHLRCISLRNCSVFMWILDNTRKMKTINANQVFRMAEKKMCDVDELISNSPLTLDSRIACPDVPDKPEYDLEERLDYDDQNSINYVEDYEYLSDNENDSDLLNERNIHDLLSEDQKAFNCIGAIEFHHGPVKDPLSDLQILHFSNKWKEIGNIQKLKNRRILRVKANGNCCWKIYRRKRFLGRFEPIYQGYDKYPRIQLRSLRKVDC